MRDLVFHELNTQCSISNSVLYLNDCRASLNDSDFFNATGRLNLRQPYQYNGKISASVMNLSTLQPLVRSFGNQSELAGSVTLDWQGEGQGMTPKAFGVAPWKNSGKLKFVLEKGRYGNAQSIRENIYATYLLEVLDVTSIFDASGKTEFTSVKLARRKWLEIY